MEIMYLKLTDQEIRDFITRNGHRKMIITQGKEFIHEDSENIFDIKGISDDIDVILTQFFEDDITFQMVDERIQQGIYPLLCKGVQTQRHFITTPQGGLITTEPRAWTGTHDTILEITKTVFNNWCVKHRK